MSSFKKLGGVPHGYQPFILDELFKKHQKSIVFVSSTEEHLYALKKQLGIINPNLPTLIFPAWDCLPYDRVSPGLDVVTARLETLTKLLENPEPTCILTSTSALTQRLAPRLSLLGESLNLKSGISHPREQLLKELTDKGYSRRETVYEAGDYAVRGSILDLFPTNAPYPIRIDFFGDTIETLRTFDP